MELPNDMPEGLKALLRKMSGAGRDEDKCRRGECRCQQVLQLAGEDMLKLKNKISEADKIKRKAALLIAELETLKRQNENNWTAFWEGLYEKFGLMSRNDYHWVEDGRIMQIPDGEE